MSVKIRATQEYPYDNKIRKKGDVFDASENDASGLVLVGMAEYVDKYATKVMSTENAEPLADKPMPRGRYPRRDMRPQE